MDMTNAERIAKHRAKRKAEGWIIVHCQIPPKAAKILAGRTLNGLRTQSEVLAEALLSS